MSKETETVSLTVTVEIPEKVHKLLENFATFAGASLEEMLKNQLEADVRGLWHDEIFYDWVQSAIEKAGCAGYFLLNQGETE